MFLQTNGKFLRFFVVWVIIFHIFVM